MANTSRLADSQSLTRSDVTLVNRDWHRSVSAHQRHPAAKPYRRFNRSIGFWLGGILLGVGGCILGGFMPYSHPVAVTISVLWWGIYFGCFGSSIGALSGLWAEQNGAPRSPGQVVRAGTGAGRTAASLPTGYSGSFK